MTTQNKSYGAALKMGVDFVSAIIVGLVIGYWADKYFHTSPLFLIIFLILGAVAGFRNVYKYATKVVSEKNDEDDHA